jgi:hypothetical protein
MERESGFTPEIAYELAEGLERFAKLVAEAEREECAKRLDALGCDHCADAIRARGRK